MKRLALALAAFFLLAGCDTGDMMDDTITLPPADAGPDAVSVYLDAGGPGGPASTPPNGAAACPTGACNYQTGSGCSGAMSSCLPTPTGNTAAPACVAPGSVAAGGACVQATDCVAGHVCAGGLCRKLCCGGDWSGCDSASEHCLEGFEYINGSMTVQTGAMLCYPVNVCDALNPASCTASGTTCQIADITGVTACLPEGSGGAGQPCPCKGGFACVQPSGSQSYVCARLCKAVPGGGAPYCQVGEGICTHYNRDPQGVGECQPPM